MSKLINGVEISKKFMSNLFKSKFILGLVVLGAVVFATTAEAAITSTLRVGSRGAQVTELQNALNVSPATGYFGAKTKAAVKAFQTANGFTADGVFGRISRSALVGGGSVSGNFPSGCQSAAGFSPTTGLACNSVNATPGTPVVQSGPVSVALAMTNPAAGYVVAGQAGARLAAFSFSGSGSVATLVLNRGGLSTNDVLTNVYLFDGNTRISDAASVTSTGVITFNNPSGLFTAPKVIEIRADIQAPTNNSTSVNVAVASYTVVGGVATPVTTLTRGNDMAISLTGLAGVTLTNNQGNSNLNVNAGTVGQNIWDVTANVGTRAVSLKALTFKYVGSASNDAAQNLSLYVDGIKVGSTSTVNAMGLLSFDLSNAPVALATGNRTIQLRGDFIKGSGRTAQFYVQNAADYMIEDSQIAGAFISPTSGTNVYGYNFQIQNGSLVVSQDPTWTATQVVGGASNAVIGKFSFKAYGEDTKVETLILTPTTTLAGYVSGARLQNVTLYVNGGAVGSSQNWTSGTMTFNPGSNMIVPAGTAVILEVKADLRDGAGNNYTGTSVQVDVTSSGSSARGQSSQNSVTINNQSGKSLTIGSATVSFGKTGGFFGTTVTPNTSNVVLGSFTLSNSNFENVRTTNMLSGMTFGGGMTSAFLSNLRVTGSATVVAQPTGTDNFSMDDTTNVNTSKVYTVTADIGSVAAAAAATATSTASTAVAGSAGTTSTVTGGVVTALTLATGGAGYTSAPAVTIQTPGVVLLTRTTAGTTSGLSDGVYAVTFSAVCAVAPTGTVTIGTNAATAVTLTTPGIGCASIPTVTFTGIGTAVVTATLGTQATAVNATISGGAVTAVTIAGGVAGTGYGSAPTVTIAAGTGPTVLTNLTASYRGIDSGLTTTAAASPAGVTMTFNTSTLVSGNVTKNSSSASSQLVVSQTIFSSAVSYNVKSATAPVTISEMTFSVSAVDNVTGISVAGGPVKTITGTTGNIVTGLNLVVPAGNAGLDILVQLTYGTVAYGGLISSTTLDTSATLTAIKYTSGNTTTTLSSLSLASNAVQLVGSKPVLTYSASNVTGLTTGAEQKIGEITVVVDAKGNIKVDQVKFNATMSGITGSPAITAPRIADGSTTVPGTFCDMESGTLIRCNFTSAANATQVLGSGYGILASGSKTFSLFANVAGTLGASGTSAVSTSIAGQSAVFLWEDVNGGVASALTGANILNFPTASYTIKN